MDDFLAARTRPKWQIGGIAALTAAVVWVALIVILMVSIDPGPDGAAQFVLIFAGLYGLPLVVLLTAVVAASRLQTVRSAVVCGLLAPLVTLPLVVLML